MTIRVISAAKLDSESKIKIEKVFVAKHPGDEVKFSHEVNPELIGGVMIIDGGNIYDGSVKGMLANIGRSI